MASSYPGAFDSVTVSNGDVFHMFITYEVA